MESPKASLLEALQCRNKSLSTLGLEDCTKLINSEAITISHNSSLCHKKTTKKTKKEPLGFVQDIVLKRQEVRKYI